jgi:hypothetical protein
MCTKILCKQIGKGNKEKNVTEKWSEMLAQFAKENINSINIKCLISFCLALSRSKAPIECVFSIINALRSDKKKRT